MKERPFSLILFDEIEKAHPRVMDKVPPAVLDDGRLTDGQGETAYFSHSPTSSRATLGRLTSSGPATAAKRWSACLVTPSAMAT